MSRVLGIVGSPRKGGNTHVLVSELLGAAADAGAETCEVLLGGLTIRECDGCHACWAGKYCPKADDMDILYDQLAAADAIVFGTPVYWYGPTALMKAFLDRFVYFNCEANRPKVRGKRAGLVVPLEESDPTAADGVVTMFERSLAYLEMELAGRVIAPGVTKRGEVKACGEAMARARELGRRLAERA